MKRCISIGLVLLLSVIHAGHAQQRGHRSPFAIRIVGPQVILPDEETELQIEVQNVSNRPTKFVPPLDASEVGWRYPRTSLVITDSQRNVVPPLEAARCGNYGEMRAITFIRCSRARNDNTPHTGLPLGSPASISCH